VGPAQDARLAISRANKARRTSIHTAIKPP
jgi:hypothetical protein